MSLLGMIGGMAYDHSNERRNYRNERNLAEQQYGHQRGLNQQGHDLQMDMWNKTNYGAQVEHMKNAGLNPALMYKGAGVGGTTGSQTGGSASKGNSQMRKAMDIGNMLVGAEIKLKKALAGTEDKKQEDLQSQIDYRDGVNTDRGRAEIGNLTANERNTIQKTTNLKTDNEVRKVEKELLELKASKKVTGSTVVDLMTQVGLDPVNNPDDRNAVKMILGAYFGSKVVKDLMQGMGGLKGKSIKNVGDRIYKNTNEIKY
jgi:hypothetical protein